MFKKLNESNNSNLYLKLKDGESIYGVFVGEAFEYFQNFQQKTIHANWADGRSFKFDINFIETDNVGNPLKLKLLSRGKTFASLLDEMIKEYSQNYFFRISRKGSNKDDTEYHIFPKGPLSQKQFEDLKNFPLINLTKPFSDEKILSDNDVPF